MTTLKVVTAVDEIWSIISPGLNSVGVPVFKLFAPYAVHTTGETYVVVRQGQTGQSRSQWHTGLSRPTVWVNIFADSTRNADGLVTAHDAESKALAVQEYLHPLLHGRMFGQVIRCELRDEPTLIFEPDTNDEACLLSSVYNVDMNTEAPVMMP